MKEIEFSFNRSSLNYTGNIYLNDIKVFYEKVFQDYISLLSEETKEGQVKIKFLNINTNLEEYSPNKSNTNSVSSILPHTVNLQIQASFKRVNKNYEDFLFSFNMYSQNNCCGAMTISNTSVGEYFKKQGIGKILQFMKEDIAYNQRVSLLTCTDIYWFAYNGGDDPHVNELKPYLPNTNLLLSSGWKVVDKFYNFKSNNVVALYTKNIGSITDKVNLIKMKIKKTNNKLIKIDNITIGCDPELFFRSKETGNFIPSFYVMKGDKWNPTPITTKGHAISCDNVMAEYMIPPCKTAKQFVKHNMLVQNYLEEKIATPNNLELVIFPYAEFDENDLISDQAKMFGCEPDFSVYNGGKPNIVGKPKLNARCSGKIVCHLN